MPSAKELRLRKALCEIGRRLYDRGYLAGTDGNLSVRLDRNSLLVTPSGAAKGFLRPADLIVAGLDGKVKHGRAKPSSELAMHLEIYHHRPEITACVHSHPPFVTALAVTCIPLPDNVLPEIVAFVGRIKITEYAAPGTAAVAKSLHPDLADCNAFILKNHGLLTLGRTLEEAWSTHEMVESFAKVFWLAQSLGKVDALPDEEVIRLRSLVRDASVK